MCDAGLIEYRNFNAAQNLCIADYGSKDLCIDDAEELRCTSAWDQLNSWLDNRIKQWPQRYDKESVASTQEELLTTEENLVKQLIIGISLSPFISYRQKLADRILTLFKKAREEDEFSVGVALSSLRSFYYFISSNSELRRPKLSLTPESNIYASWKSGSDKILSIHFLTDGDARFVIFKPNERRPDKPIRLSGIAPVDDLMQNVINPHGISWALE